MEALRRRTSHRLCELCGSLGASISGTPPVTTEEIAGTEVKRMTLTDMAFQRLEISTADVLEEVGRAPPEGGRHRG